MRPSHFPSPQDGASPDRLSSTQDGSAISGLHDKQHTERVQLAYLPQVKDALGVVKTYDTVTLVAGPDYRNILGSTFLIGAPVGAHHLSCHLLLS